ncbi:hypothetical protein Tco_1437240 [Tanacetum coccineum]
MIDEYFNPPTIVVSPIPVAVAPRAIDLANSPVSKSIDQDAPSTSILSTQEQEHSLIISQGFEESPKMPHFHDDPLYKSLHEDSTSQGSSSNVRPIYTPFESLGRWTKDHPIANMSFFLGLQISQSPRGIFLNQSKYASKIIKKYGLLTSDSVDTPAVKKNKLDEDLQRTPVDATLCRGMIGSLMYLISSRPNLIYAVCLCARYQAKPTEKHLNAVKRIFRYLREPLTWDSGTQRITEQVENGIVELYFVRTEYQLADIFTKPLPRERFNFLIKKLGMKSMSPEMLKRLTEEEDETITTKAQQIAQDNALVASENQRGIGKCNMRINLGMKPKEPTYQVVLDAHALTTCYPAFLITAEVPVIYMHQFWATVNKHKASYRFKINNKMFFVNVEVFIEILNICPKIPGQEFDKPPSEEETLSFIRELGHSGEIKYITDVIVDHLHQPWRTFVSLINKCLCGKVSGLDKIRLSRVQILWGMYYKKNLDFVAIIWEDLAYQIDNKDSKKQDKMFYPRFTKIIIHHFLEKDKSISMRNGTFMHTARDNILLETMIFVSRHKDTQIYGVILPKAMTNQAMLDSIAYKTYYAIASGAEPPKSKKSQKKSDSAISSKESLSKKKLAKAMKDIPSTKKPTTKPKPTKKKAPVKADRGKSLNVLSEVALSQAAQLNEVTKPSKKDFHISHASGSGDGTDFQSGVPDEQQRKISSTDEGSGAKLGVPDIPKYDFESDKES